MKPFIHPKPNSSGFILPMVIVLVLIVGLIASARLARYRFKVQQRIEQNRQIKANLALDSGLVWLTKKLNDDPAFHGPETWTIPAAPQSTIPVTLANTNWITVAGDGHRFVIDYFFVTRVDQELQTNQTTRVVTFENIENTGKFRVTPLQQRNRKGKNTP